MQYGGNNHAASGDKSRNKKKDEKVSFFRRLLHRARSTYRNALDVMEEMCLGCANIIMVNSRYTANVFSVCFSLLGKDVLPLVVYPTLEPPHSVSADAKDSAARNRATQTEQKAIEFLYRQIGENNENIENSASGVRTHVFLSLNRYERKKKVELALRSLAELKRTAQRKAMGENDRFLLVSLTFKSYCSILLLSY